MSENWTIQPTTTLGEIGNATPAARQVDAAVRSAGVVNRPGAQVIYLNDYLSPLTMRGRWQDFGVSDVEN